MPPKTPIAQKERFGANLRNARLNRGLTQLDLAGLLHTWPQTIQRWEGAITYPIPRTMLEIAKALETTIQELREEATNGDHANED